MPPHSHDCCSRHLIGGAHLSRCLVFTVVSLAPINVICHRTTETHNSLHVSCSQTSNTLLPQAPAPQCDVFCLRRVRCLLAPASSCVYGRTRVAVEFQLCQPEQGHGPNCKKGCTQMLQKTRNNTNAGSTVPSVCVGSSTAAAGGGQTICLPRLALRARHYLAIGTWDIRRCSHQFQLLACASCWMIRRSRY